MVDSKNSRDRVIPRFYHLSSDNSKICYNCNYYNYKSWFGRSNNIDLKKKCFCSKIIAIMNRTDLYGKISLRVIVEFLIH